MLLCLAKWHDKWRRCQPQVWIVSGRNQPVAKVQGVRQPRKAEGAGKAKQAKEQASERRTERRRNVAAAVIIMLMMQATIERQEVQRREANTTRGNENGDPHWHMAEETCSQRHHLQHNHPFGTRKDESPWGSVTTHQHCAIIKSPTAASNHHN